MATMNHCIHVRVNEELNKALVEEFEKVKSKEVRNLSEYVRSILENHIKENGVLNENS